MKWSDNTTLTIVIIGAINWLLVGIFRFDLVAFLFGNLSWLSRIIYTVVGLCGLYLISMYGRFLSRIAKLPFCKARGILWMPLVNVLFICRYTINQGCHILVKKLLCICPHHY